jgi:tubulin--tyrosine ligase
MPITYCINDHNWPQVLSQLADDFYRKDSQYYTQLDNMAWILKPALLNNGQAIQIFANLNALAQHFASTRRLGGEHVLQRYITHPHLLRDHRKYSIRQFILLTNFAGAFLYPQGYFNVSMHPYAGNDLTDLKSHLTNEHLFGNEPNVIQIPTARFDLHTSLYPQIKAILQELAGALLQRFPEAFVPEKQRVFALFGMDFMVDASGRVWLLEANHGPCFPIDDDHPLQSHLYRDFWRAVIDGIVLPVANNSDLDSEVVSVFDRIL